MSVFYEFEEVDAFTTGAVGRPGDRTFFLQARAERPARRRQVREAAGRRDRRSTSQGAQRPPAARGQADGGCARAGTTRSRRSFVLGPIGLGYDRSADKVLRAARRGRRRSTRTASDRRADDGHIRLYVTRGQAAAFCEHAEKVVAAGRPDCQWCGHPIDPDGHAMPEDELRTCPPRVDERTGVELESTIPDPIALLLRGEPEIEGRMPWSSNATFLVHARPRRSSSAAAAIYKPVRGERPLWDFEPGLHRRERAAYLLSERSASTSCRRRSSATVRSARARSSGSSTPTTASTTSRSTSRCPSTARPVPRHRGARHPRQQHRPQERATACSSPSRRDPATSGRSTTDSVSPPEYKLRTVIWEFAGESIPEHVLDRGAPLVDASRSTSPHCSTTTRSRRSSAGRRCVTERRFPTDPSGRRYPWPLV